ncbi:MAG: hypothetical protein ACI4QX_06615, partial [Lachnospiraceae bacterium]
MGNEKKNSTGRFVLLIFAVIFSVILVPVLFAMIPVGGTLTALSGLTSQERLEEVLEEAGLSENLYEAVMEEAVNENDAETLRAEEFERILRDSFTVGEFDKIILVFFDSMYNGTRAEFDLSGFEEKFEKNLEALCENGFDDLYSAWRNGTESVYFSEEFCRSFCREIEAELIEEYPDYNAGDIAELEEKYDAHYGTGAFSALLDERTDSLREEWSAEIDELLGTQIEDMVAEMAAMLEDAAFEAAREPDVREVFDILKQYNNWSGRITTAVYAVLIGVVLFLLLLYWFEIPGFLVCSVPILLGGILCKFIGFIEEPLLTLLDEQVLSEASEAMEYADVVRAVMHGIISPFLQGI